MNETSEQKIYQATGIINLAECYLGRDGLTKSEIEFLQQSLSGAASLLSEVVNSSPPRT